MQLSSVLGVHNGGLAVVKFGYMGKNAQLQLSILVVLSSGLRL